MASLFGPDGSKLRGAWQYWRPSGCGIVELGTVRGQKVSLPAHFHEEDQITFVLSGQRRFVIGGKLVDVLPGQGAHFPAGTPHCSLSTSSEVNAINIYTAPGPYAVFDLIAALSRFWRNKGNIPWSEIAVIVEEHRRLASAAADHIGGEEIYGRSWETVGQAAKLAGMSREGFSRRFRRLQGMPPHMFSLTERLNDARKLLRAGEPIAAVAAETGFSDQSHLGRCFRRAFGVTPGQYRLR
jgi:AraC-like DNA-binding protein